MENKSTKCGKTILQKYANTDDTEYLKREAPDVINKYTQRYLARRW